MLDYKAALNLYELLQKLNKDYGKTIIVIEHDTDFLLRYAGQAIILDHGTIVLKGPAAFVLSHKKELKTLGIKIPQPIL
jgi:ABC-type cobalamin/Fe3+-siderophores transport system ATPase subunit